MIYFVATPIGNLEDITLRALGILKSADIIACEDTRTSMKLLSKFDIKSKLVSFHKFNENEMSEKIIKESEDGKIVAIISDAGMPVISDPGNCLTKILRQRNIEFSVIPGANAGLCALVLSGLDASSFFFYGFLPEKNVDRKDALTKLSLIDSTIIFYVAPHNLQKDISDIHSLFGNREVALVKEITKIHETVYRFNLCDQICFEKDKEGKFIDPKGEFVMVVSKPEKNEEENNMTIPEHVRFFINLGLSKNDAIKKVAKERNVSKSVIYKEVLNI